MNPNLFEVVTLIGRVDCPDGFEVHELLRGRFWVLGRFEKFPPCGLAARVHASGTTLAAAEAAKRLLEL